MRLGLLTYHWVANYGANLQMYSTYMYLKNNGYNPIVINWIPTTGIAYYQAVSGHKQLSCHRSFYENRCEITREFSDLTDYPLVLKEYGITHVIVGSDSVFNIIKERFDWFRFKKISVTVDHTFPNPFWCNNIKIPHAALSVSSQNANFKEFYNVREKIGCVLKDFAEITVRDLWTQSMISYFSKGEIVPDITPDPVFGFNVNVKRDSSPELIRTKFNLPEKYVLFTFNNGRMKASLKWISLIKKLFNNAGYACVYLPRSTGSQSLQLDYEIEMPIDPLDWYDIIRYSNGYIGVLMHPIVVCLHNNVPCFSFDHYGKGPLFFSSKKSSKIYDIMKKANLLENHYFLRRHIMFPSPNYVYEKIVGFPINRISHFSSEIQTACIANMNRIVSCLKASSQNDDFQEFS